MNRELLQARGALLRNIRQFFADKDVLEVTTPVCSRGTGTDPAIEPLTTRYQGPGYPGGLTLYLQTSPELAMKRLLARASGAIYQICQVFRDGELGRLHNPEFTLLEWYRPGFDHHRLMEETAALVCLTLGKDLSVEKVSYRELYREIFRLDPIEAEVSQLIQAASDAGVTGVDAFDSMDKDDWLDLLMSHVVEDRLGRDGLTFIYDYPASQASLARLNPADKHVASRFELYYQGVELANGFHELTDPAEQRKRFLADNRQREARGQKVLPLDERFLDALEQGVPDCAGVALGLDRLFMLSMGASSLAEVMPFSLREA